MIKVLPLIQMLILLLHSLSPNMGVSAKNTTLLLKMDTTSKCSELTRQLLQVPHLSSFNMGCSEMLMFGSSTLTNHFPSFSLTLDMMFGLETTEEINTAEPTTTLIFQLKPKHGLTTVFMRWVSMMHQPKSMKFSESPANKKFHTLVTLKEHLKCSQPCHTTTEIFKTNLICSLLWLQLSK